MSATCYWKGPEARFTMGDEVHLKGRPEDEVLKVHAVYGLENFHVYQLNKFCKCYFRGELLTPHEEGRDETQGQT